MKKLSEVFIIILVITVMLSGAIAFVVMGSRSTHTHYVCLEVNPRVEFLTDAKHKVKSLRPINQEAKELLINENFVGLNMEDACNKFLELCARAGYIKVDGDNAVKLTVLSGLNQMLEVNISKNINKFFVDNNILGIVVDNSQDLQVYKNAKKQGVDIERYDLMMAVSENDNSISLEKLKVLSNKKLIKLIEEGHKDYDMTYTEEELNNKKKLIDANKETYDNHIENITSDSTKEFKMKLKDYRLRETKNYKVDFSTRYNEVIK